MIDDTDPSACAQGEVLTYTDPGQRCDVDIYFGHIDPFPTLLRMSPPDGPRPHRVTSLSRHTRVYAAGCTGWVGRQAEWTANTDRATQTRRVPVTGALRGVVALDGPSGTGKTTVARKLCTQLCARNLDTGSTYRTLTLAVLRAGVDPSEVAEIGDMLARAGCDIGSDQSQHT